MKWQELKAEWAKDPKRRAVLRSEFPYRQLADELVALRAGLGLTQAQLAQRTNTSQSVIARLESGRHPVTVKTLTTIASAVGMDWRISFEPAEIAGAEALGGFEIEVRPNTMPQPAPVRNQKKRVGTNSYALAA